MSIEEIEILRERSEKFMKNAEHLYETGVYDLAGKLRKLVDGL